MVGGEAMVALETGRVAYMLPSEVVASYVATLLVS